MGIFSKQVKRATNQAVTLSLALLTAVSGMSTVPALGIQAKAAAEVLSDERRGVIYANSRSDFRDESIYFLITTRFYDGDTSNNARTSEDDEAQNPAEDPSWRGDFKGLIDKLDYIKALGFTAIWITPVVENNSGYDYHGYHAYNFSAVDKRYESNGVTYQTLIDACHEKGMKVIQDVVLNHTCNWGEENLLHITNPVYEGGRSEYVMPAGAAFDQENIYHHNGFTGSGDYDNYEAQRKTIDGNCFDLETENPKVYNYLVDCYTKYINMGVDAFRIDTAKHISRLTFNSVFLPAFKETGGEDFYMFGEVCTKGHDVWYRDAPPISTCFYTWAEEGKWRNCWTDSLEMNETLVEQHYNEHMDTSKQPTSDNAFLKGNEYHSPDYSKSSGMGVIDFQMHWSFMNANSAYSVALNQDKYFNDSTWNVVYVDSHDYAPDECQDKRYVGGTDAWAENLSLMFTFRGIPCIYYGTEIEFQAGKPIDKGKYAKLSETGRAYFGDHIEGNVDTEDFTVFGNLSGEVENTLNAALSQHIIRLNRIRQAIPALRKGQYSTEGVSGNMAFKRRYTDSKTDSFVCVAISGDATFTGIPNGKYTDAVTGDTQTVTGGTLTAKVSGKGNMKVYVLDTAKTPAPGRVIPNGDYLTDGGTAELIKGKPIDVKKVEVTGISVDKKSVTIKETETVKVTAEITPSNATNKTIIWTSSDNSVATVSGGTIKGISKGTATITASSNNGKTATIKVTVTENTNIVKPTGITVSPTTLTLTEGSTGTISATITPSNATDKSVTWTSSNSSVATVDTSGKVTAVSEGAAKITATSSNGKTAAASVTVEPKKVEQIEGIYFEKPKDWGSNVNVYMYDSSSNTTVGTAWPGKAMTNSGNGVYTYEYKSDSSTLKVIFNDGNHQIPASQQPGFDFKNNGYYNSSGFVKVIEKPKTIDVTSVSLSATKATLNIGDTKILSATVTPSNATNQTITWTSSNSSVAKVSSTGVVTAVANGTATITASSDNGKTAAATITVKKNSTPELVNQSKISSPAIQLGESITATAAATGGTGSYTYAFYYRKTSDTKWTEKQTYSTKKTVTIKPAHSTTYEVCIKVKDSNAAVKKKYFTVEVSKALNNTSKLSSSEIVLGDKITVNFSATGGTGYYQYAAYYRRANTSKWTTVQSYSQKDSAVIQPAAATDYEVCLKVKDSNGAEVKKYLTVKVSAKKVLSNNSKISSTAIELGESITATAAATGGTGSYSYAFYYRKTSDTKWTEKQTYSSKKTVTIKPAHSTTYEVCIKVRDSRGTVEKKYFNVNVKKASTLANHSSISSESVKKGSSVTVKCSASNGTAPYTYKVERMVFGSTSWTTVQNSSATTASVKIPTADMYQIRVTVSDSTGKTAVKYFTVSGT